MITKISFWSIAALLMGYMIFAMAFIAPKAHTADVCKQVKIEVANASERPFISDEEVLTMLKKRGLSPKGKALKQINTAKIEEKLLENKIIRKVECFKTIDGTVKVKIYQRTPFMRIFAVDNGSFYVDKDRNIIPVMGIYPAYVPVVSGFISEEFAKKELFDFVKFIQNDDFWNSQIAQIFVAQNGDIELTPKVGNHQIILGQLSDYHKNLKKLRTFYDKGLNKIGWNKYSVINLKYKNQVVCSRK
ncbi:MAG: hypothetical protein LBJ17_06755 [Dysgonamonadaceae bacterium]|nr:hypothetical protein [Dysgonamonadaceae bacterium]